MSSKQDTLRNLLCLQRKKVPDVGLYGKLTFEDLKRIDLKINGDITKSITCCLYTGAIVGKSYSTFSFRGKKVSLLRILYHNLIDDLEPDMKIIYNCKNNGICCNLDHFIMIKPKDISEIEEKSDSCSDSDENEEKDENIFKFD